MYELPIPEDTAVVAGPLGPNRNRTIRSEDASEWESALSATSPTGRGHRGQSLQSPPDLYVFGVAFGRTRIPMPASFHSGFKLSLQCNMRISYHCCRRKGRIIPSGFRFELNAFNELVYWNTAHEAFNGSAF